MPMSCRSRLKPRIRTGSCNTATRSFTSRRSSGSTVAYSFRVRPPASDHPSMSVLIRHHASEGETMRAAITGTKVPLTDRRLIQAFVVYPLMTLKVIAGIHWHAVRLWFKGAKFHSHRRRAPLRPLSGDATAPAAAPRDEASV